MSDRAAARLAWAILALVLVLGGTAFAVAAVWGTLEANQIVLFAPLSALSFSIVGAFVAAGAPRNAIGWLLLTAGLLIGLGLLTSAVLAVDERDPGSVPGAAFAALADGGLWLVSIGFLIPRLMLLFPDGRPPTRRWRIVGQAQWLMLAGLLVSLLAPGPLNDYERYRNPVGIGALDFMKHLPSVAGAIAGLVFATVALSSVAALLVRFKRSRGAERMQMKWVAWAVGLTAALFVAGPLAVALTGSQTLGDVLSGVGLVGLVLAPVAVGMAVLRYRLYEIDRVVSRTLVYGVLTVFLALVYVGLVLLGQELFSSFAGGSNLAIAVSTLVVAALFLPVRARLQGIVDRRFNRRRYDAQRTLDGFGARLREQVELETLHAELVGVVGETMQPAHAALWLREGAR